MAISLLDNIAGLTAQNELNATQNSLQTTLVQLSTGSRINSGADDPAGLSIANQLGAAIAALQQSSSNVNNGIGLAQTADGTLSQVTNLLNRAVTIATEAANGGLTPSQQTALNTEFTSIKTEIDRIGQSTTFNGALVFQAGRTTSVFLSDAATSSTIGVTPGGLSSSVLGLAAANVDLTSTANAQTALTAVNTAIGTVAATRGTLGAAVNQLNSASAVIANQVQNITQAQSNILSANIPQEVSNMAKFQILNQTGIAALGQANQTTQSLLALFR